MRRHCWCRHQCCAPCHSLMRCHSLHSRNKIDNDLQLQNKHVCRKYGEHKYPRHYFYHPSLVSSVRHRCRSFYQNHSHTRTNPFHSHAHIHIRLSECLLLSMRLNEVWIQIGSCMRQAIYNVFYKMGFIANFLPFSLTLFFFSWHRIVSLRMQRSPSCHKAIENICFNVIDTLHSESNQCSHF